METTPLTYDLFHQPPPLTGSELRDKGISNAIGHAEFKNPGWNEQAYEFLLKYIKTVDEFMAEDLREAAKGIVIEPPSLRAWGGVIVRASKQKLIKRTGFRNVTNAKAHATPASVWSKI
ncbi:MAG TPA: hypothetical protein PK289_00130 [Bacteroidia bacterium]|nr:hypothetical protein [Bacteroidia bacterium]